MIRSKSRLKQILYTLEMNIIAIISNSLVHGTPKQQTLRLIKAEIMRISRLLGLSMAETNTLWINAYKKYNDISKQVFSKLRKIGVKKTKEVGYDVTLRARQNVVYDVVHKLLYDGELEHEKNEMADLIEQRVKQDDLRNMISLRASPLYLCSSHKNPAKDHADWEGKVYFDENWKNYITDPEEVARIEAYIRNRKLRSVQWVTGGPVWMVTRRNCRHYMIPIPIEEALTHSRKSLLKRHEMFMPDKKTISYEMAQYRRYYERLKALLHLRKISPSEKLEEDIKETRRLVRLWRSRCA